MLRWLFNRHLALALLWTLGIVLIAVGVNLVGIHIVGDVKVWNRWLAGHRSHFFAWRLCVYCATAYGWRWMHQRVRRREPAAETQGRLRRTEIAAVLAILAMEGTVFLQLP